MARRFTITTSTANSALGKIHRNWAFHYILILGYSERTMIYYKGKAMAKHSEIREMLEAKAQQLSNLDKGNTMAHELLVYGRITRCANGGAHSHKPIIRSRQSRRYSGNDGIPNSLKDEAKTIQNQMVKLMGDSSERMNNLKLGHGSIVSKRTLKQTQKLKMVAQELTNTAKEMTSGHQEPIMAQPQNFKLIKKAPRESFRGARGISAYSSDATQLQTILN